MHSYFAQWPRGGSRILVWEGHWHGGLRTSPSGVQGQNPGEGLRAMPPNINVLRVWPAFLFCSMTQERIQDFGSGGAVAGGLGISPSGVQGQNPGKGLGPRPLKPWEMLRHKAEKSLKERKTSPYRLASYDNLIIIIISSTHRFMFPAIFVLYTKRSLWAPEPAKWSTMAPGPNKASLLEGTLPQCP